MSRNYSALFGFVTLDVFEVSNNLKTQSQRGFV